MVDVVRTEAAWRKRLEELGSKQERYEASVINLIASDNVVPAWRSTTLPYRGDMIQEGIVSHRPFAGARIHDEIETLTKNITEDIFSIEHAVLQSHSCSQANQAVYHALLEPGDHVLALQFRAGGHLTHGMRANFSGRHYNFHFYGLDENARIDYEALQATATKTRPALIICGSSSYPFTYDVQRLRSIADAVGAKLHLDLSHEAGLIAGGAFDCPLHLADVVTMSLDKTLRGPHGAAILTRTSLARSIDAAVHPGTQSSFPIRRLTDAATALIESRSGQFRAYTRRACSLTATLAQNLDATLGSCTLGTGEKHYLLLDTRQSLGISGLEAESRLEAVGILTNRQSLPTDESNALTAAGGLRLGTAWLSSCGYEVTDMADLSALLVAALEGVHPAALKPKFVEIRDRTRHLDVRTWLEMPSEAS